MMEQHFPMTGGDEMFELAHVERHDEGDGRLIAVLRNIVFDRHDGQRAVRDIKEQCVPCALASVIARCVFEELEIAMPVDLVPEDVLDLVSARDQAGFVNALEAKSRLGGLLT